MIKDSATNAEQRPKADLPFRKERIFARNGSGVTAPGQKEGTLIYTRIETYLSGNPRSLRRSKSRANRVIRRLKLMRSLGLKQRFTKVSPPRLAIPR